MRQARSAQGRGLQAGLVLLLGLSSGLAIASERAPEVGSRVRLASPFATAVVRSSVQRAAARLRGPECRRIFSDFADASGRSLQARLDELGQPGDGYLDLLAFRDGSGTAACARRGLAGADPVLGEALLIHELLHSLGLGEGPPSPEAITAGVLARCH